MLLLFSFIFLSIAIALIVYGVTWMPDADETVRAISWTGIIAFTLGFWSFVMWLLK